MPTTADATRRTRRTDPGRRDRIVDACLDVVADVGVAGASHRRIAAAADVPLGSMTYPFAGMDELLREAFTRFADGVADGFERRMAAAVDVESAREAVVAAITEDIFGDRRDLVLTHLSGHSGVVNVTTSLIFRAHPGRQVVPGLSTGQPSA